MSVLDWWRRVFIGLGGFGWPGCMWAQEPGSATAGGSAHLPLKRIKLFTAGVGFFEHQGELIDQAQVELRFRSENINDLLKSMVINDEGGNVPVVTYASNDPISRTLKSFAVDLTANPTRGELLNQLRGERVRVYAPLVERDALEEGGQEITGIILGIEVRKVKRDNELKKTEFLTLVTDKGIRSLDLDKEGLAITLLSENINRELSGALAALANARDTDKKTVVIRFTGEGKRQGRIGYILETPVWKTTYRLVLEEGKPALLEGWAIVENTTEQDWNEVNLTLVSGRPISFQMDLYEPVYLSRPWEQLELHQSVRPTVHEQDLLSQPTLASARASYKQKETYLANLPLRESAPKLASDSASIPSATEEIKEEKTGQGVAFRGDQFSAAKAAQVGEAFQYEVLTPVRLTRQQSAMLPILRAEIPAEKVSIYNPSVHPKHPLLGVRITNTSSYYFMQGPMTVFDQGVYAGEAKTQDIPPDSQRLVSYGLDLQVEAAAEEPVTPSETIYVQLIQGSARIRRRLFRSQVYQIKNSSEKVRTVLIEHPYRSNWTLVNPKEPSEKTRDMYRFQIVANPGQSIRLAVEEEFQKEQVIAIARMNEELVTVVMNSQSTSEQVKEAIRQVRQMNSQMNKLEDKRSDLEYQIDQIRREQARIRKNMPQVDKTSDLYQRYVQKLSQQEDQIEQLQAQLVALGAEIETAKKNLADYLTSLDVE